MDCSTDPLLEPLTLVNLTRHAVKLVLSGGQAIEMPPSGRVAFVVAPAPRRWICLIQVGSGPATPVEVLDEPSAPRGVALPAPRPGVAYLVSARVAEACPGRDDLLTPATGPGEGALRDAQGRVTAVTRLKRFRRVAPSATRAVQAKEEGTAS